MKTKLLLQNKLISCINWLPIFQKFDLKMLISEFQDDEPFTAKLTLFIRVVLRSASVKLYTYCILLNNNLYTIIIDIPINN